MLNLAWPYHFILFVVTKRSAKQPLAVLCRESSEFVIVDWPLIGETLKVQNYVWLQ